MIVSEVMTYKKWLLAVGFCYWLTAKGKKSQRPKANSQKLL